MAIAITPMRSNILANRNLTLQHCYFTSFIRSVAGFELICHVAQIDN